MKPEKTKQPAAPRQPRKPVQPRSIQTREKILEAALELFCEKGYFKTTTNEIARRAGVSIGSLYSYFSDKDTLFFEILEGYHQKFTNAKSVAQSQPELLQADPVAWLRLLIDNLIRVHEESRELNRELNVVAYYNPKVAAQLEENRHRTLEATIGYFIRYLDGLKVDDPEAAAIVAFDLISSTVDRIVFNDSDINRNRLIHTTIDLLMSYFARSTTADRTQ
jgi:AcrR family transcriptional regulator